MRDALLREMTVLVAAMPTVFPGRIAAASSFGTNTAHFVAHDPSRRRLLARGHHVIGCLRRIAPARPGEVWRSGRWQGSAKTERAIHATRFRYVDGAPTPWA